MEFRNVVTFLKVAELQSFTLAAEGLGYSQSAVTVQIRRLEQELGTTLFDRFGKRTALTSAGEEFIPYAKKLIAAHQEAAFFADRGNMLTGELRIGTTASQAVSELPEVIIRFHERYPKVNTSLWTSDSMDRLFDKLNHNEIDLLYFMDLKRYFPEWVKVYEAPMKILFVCHPDNPVARVPSLSLKRLVEEPFAISTRGVTYTYWLEQILAEKGLELKPFVEAGTVETLVRIVTDGPGVTFLPEYAVHEELKDGRLAALEPVDFPGLTMYNQLVYRRDKWISPQMKAMVELMVSER